MALDWSLESIPSPTGFDPDMDFNGFGFDNVHQLVQDATNTSLHQQTASNLSLGNTDDADTTQVPQNHTPFPSDMALGFGLDEKGGGLFGSLDQKLDQRTSLAYSCARTNPSADTLTTVGDSASPCHKDEGEITPNSAAFCIQQLAGLSVSLHAHAATIPPPSSQSLPSQVCQSKDASPVESGTAEVRSPNATPLDRDTQKRQGFEIDHTFRLTQTLIDIYPCFISTAIQRQPDQSHTHSNPQNPQQVAESESLQSIDETNHPHVTPPRKSTIDQASILLLLSCHLRLIDIYESIFSHIQACMESSKRSACHAEQTMHAPELRIGSFAPSASAAIPMQVMLVIHLASQLLDRARELVHEVETGSSLRHRRRDAESVFADDGDDGTVSSGCQGSSGQEDDATGRMCKPIMNRATGMSQNINRFGPTLLQLAGM